MTMKPDDMYAEPVEEMDHNNMRPLLESFHSIGTSPNGSKLQGVVGTEHAIVNFEDTIYHQQRYAERDLGVEEFVVQNVDDSLSLTQEPSKILDSVKPS